MGYEDAGRPERVRTVIGEMVKDVVRLKETITQALDRVIRLEDSMRMLDRVVEKMEAPAPFEPKIREFPHGLNEEGK
jgi:phage shock protein A